MFRTCRFTNIFFQVNCTIPAYSQRCYSIIIRVGLKVIKSYILGQDNIVSSKICNRKSSRNRRRFNFSNCVGI